MMDVANYPKQTTLSVLGCEDTGMEEVITTFMDACRMVFEEKGQQVEIYPEMFKTANAGRKMGGLISLATKLAQKPEPGFTVDGLEDEYKIFLVAGQYRFLRLKKEAAASASGNMNTKEAGMNGR